jgi:hypothetical protein
MVCFPQDTRSATGTPADLVYDKIAKTMKTMPLEDLKTVRGRVLHLYTTIGEMTDAECHEMYEAHFGGVLRSSIIARRVELVRDGYIDDTGKTTDSDVADCNVQCTRWALSKDVPADVRLLNRIKRSTPREALDFALDKITNEALGSAMMDGERMRFLKLWRAKDWKTIRETWPDFAALAR